MAQMGWDLRWCEIDGIVVGWCEDDDDGDGLKYGICLSGGLDITIMMNQSWGGAESV